MSHDDCCGARPHRTGCPNETPDLFSCAICGSAVNAPENARTLHEKDVCAACYEADCIDEATRKIGALIDVPFPCNPQTFQTGITQAIRFAVDEILAQEKNRR